MRITQYRIEGLGHLSTLIADEDVGVAAVIDPRRDVDIYVEAARNLDLRISHVFETHLHNDYVSGGRELAALTGATHVIGAGADLAYEHAPARDGDAIDVGALHFGALETPGHTPEHVSYTVADTSRADEPILVLTGGSLLVGAVGRTDLLGAEHARAYAADMHRSLHEVLLRQEDSVAVYPTHGAGSLCSTGIASTSWSTIGFERRHDPLLAPMEVDAFARALLSGQPTIPRYFARMRPTNQAGPRLFGGSIPGVASLSLEAVDAELTRGGLIVDARAIPLEPRDSIPRSVAIPAGSSFATWLGWVVEPDRPLVLLVDDPADLDDLARQALRVGYESVVGHIEGGFETWQLSGRPVESAQVMAIETLSASLATGGPEAPFVIDVRQASEFEAGHVPGAIHIGAGELPERLDELPRDRPIATLCASGYRASVAVSLLRAANFEQVASVRGGVSDWEAAGLPLEYGASGGSA
ncbi:MAG: MBL fold metallo-hydrolase [Chloroflexi bacterium]|nr:MBL fold metallo-hydrolase [Chloroflexota bacterium]